MNGEQPVPKIEPQPVPMTFDVSPVPSPGGVLVMVQVRTFTGAFVMFLTADDGMHVAEAIRRAALTARSGLIVPEGLIPRPEHPERS